jgi:hypothetical protein
MSVIDPVTLAVLKGRPKMLALGERYKADDQEAAE